jgi:hypothetical protein
VPTANVEQIAVLSQQFLKSLISVKLNIVLHRNGCVCGKDIDNFILFG